MITKKIIFLGQNKIAEECLSELFKKSKYSNIELMAIVSNKELFKKLDKYIEKIIYIPNNKRNEKEIISTIKDLKINTLISVQHPWILTKKVIESVKRNCFNLHNAKLPDYKGYNSISHAILNGEKSYTSTIHWIAEKVDTGDIAFVKTFTINKNDTALSLYNKSFKKAKKNFKELLFALNHNKEIPKIPLTEEGRFYHKREIQILKRIKNMSNPEEVNRKSRAFYFPPFEPAYFILNKRKYYVTIKKY